MFGDLADVKPSIYSAVVVTLMVIVVLNVLKLAAVKLPFMAQSGLQGVILNT